MFLSDLQCYCNITNFILFCPKFSLLFKIFTLLDHLRVCVCVCVSKVHCGKRADWIRMLFGVVSGVRLGMGVLDFGGDVEGEGRFGG